MESFIFRMNPHIQNGVVNCYGLSALGLDLSSESTK